MIISSAITTKMFRSIIFLELCCCCLTVASAGSEHRTQKKLQGPNVCVRLERETITVNVSKINTYIDYEINWCWALPPRCRKKVIKKKLENYSDYLIKKTPVDYCCEGYKETVYNTCVPLCKEDCVQGDCVAPNTCRCKLGFSGPRCDTKCSNNMWGKDCIYQCDCKNGAYCDSFNGHCYCTDGWTGENCDIKCPEGTYGKQCSNQCSCKNGDLCNHVTGTCNCTLNWTGPKCDIYKRSAALLSSTSSCKCLNGGTCITNSSCICPMPWSGVLCDTCAHGFWGENCTRLCSCSNNRTCNQNTGKCDCSPGYTGDKCKYTCPSGNYGINCLNTCKCKNNGICSPVDGSCSCTAGWTGILCTDQCPEGRWGEDCNKTCYCYNGGYCDKKHGCVCPRGYTGTECFDKCPLGTFGDRCSRKCSCGNDRCSHTDGECICTLGWTGVNCTERTCPDHFYGIDCEKKCECVEKYYSCHPLYGCICLPEYTDVCASKHDLIFQENRDMPFLILNITVAICFVSIIIIIFIYICCKYCSKSCYKNCCSSCRKRKPIDPEKSPSDKLSSPLMRNSQKR